MLWGGNGIEGHLMCSGARNYQCWHSVGFDGREATRQIVRAITNELAQLEGFDTQFRALVESALREDSANEVEWQRLQADERKLMRERENLQSAILQAGAHALLSRG